MPIHDWTRVRANRFHDFHQCGTVALCNALNTECLPPGYFALIEQKTEGWESEFVPVSEATGYARKANRVTVRQHPDEEAIAILEIVSPGDKDSRQAVRTLTGQLIEFLQSGSNLLLVDLFPPGPHDPHGLYSVIWDHFDKKPCPLPPDRPLTLESYVAGTELVAYVEFVAVGQALPDMPIFLTGDRYVPCPLDATYRATWDVFPAVLKGPLEGSAGS